MSQSSKAQKRKQLAIELASQNVPHLEIAQRLGVKLSTVQNYLRGSNTDRVSAVPDRELASQIRTYMESDVSLLNDDMLLETVSEAIKSANEDLMLAREEATAEAISVAQQEAEEGVAMIGYYTYEGLSADDILGLRLLDHLNEQIDMALGEASHPRYDVRGTPQDVAKAAVAVPGAVRRVRTIKLLDLIAGRHYGGRQEQDIDGEDRRIITKIIDKARQQIPPEEQHADAHLAAARRLFEQFCNDTCPTPEDVAKEAAAGGNPKIPSFDDILDLTEKAGGNVITVQEGIDMATVLSDKYEQAIG